MVRVFGYMLVAAGFLNGFLVMSDKTSHPLLTGMLSMASFGIGWLILTSCKEGRE